MKIPKPLTHHPKRNWSGLKSKTLIPCLQLT